MHDIGTPRCSVRCAHGCFSARLFPCAWRTLLKAGTVEQVYESCGVRFRKKQGAADMELTPLGNTGVMVPEIGLGAWKYSGGEEPLRRGIELGAFLIDTAEVYGTEDVVGRAVMGIREQVFVATKVSGSHLRSDDVRRAAEASLRRLEMHYLDLYQIHWPNPRVPIKETMRAMEALVDAGPVKYIGVSNFMARM